MAISVYYLLDLVQKALTEDRLREVFAAVGKELASVKALQLQFGRLHSQMTN